MLGWLFINTTYKILKNNRLPLYCRSILRTYARLDQNSY